MTCSLLHLQGVLPYQKVGGGGGLGPHINQVHQIRGKNWEFLSPQDTKVRENFGFISEIQRAKFGYLSPIPMEAKFWAPIRISEVNFGAKPSTS